jgi:hypothetical protein
MGAVRIGEGNLVLRRRTAAKYLTLKRNVYNRARKTIFITQPYGASRTREQQAYLRNGFDRKLPGFYYAAKPDTPQANHQDRDGEGGTAFDINNWAAVGEQIIKEEAAKLGLVRDPSERWHWNDDGSNPATIDYSLLEGEGMDPRQNEMLTRVNDFWTRGEAGKHEDGEGLRTLWDIQHNVKKTREELGWERDQMDRWEFKDNALLSATVDHPLTDAQGNPMRVKLWDILRMEPKEHDNTRKAIVQLGQRFDEGQGVALTGPQIEQLASLIQPIDEEAIIDRITKQVAVEVRKIFLDAGTE